MPRDNARQGKSTNNLRRQVKKQEARSYFLIVVEGQETEYNYFDYLIRELKLPTTKIEIVPAAGGDPLVIINKACKLVQENKREAKKGNSLKFDKVFYVFDDDNKIDKFKEALVKAKENGLVSITSIPCFEFWFLLHYTYTTSPFSNYKELSPKLEAAMRKAGILKKDEAYSKSDVELYTKLKPNQDNAINNATKLAENHPNEDGCTNPSTKVHLLVKELQNQKDFK